MQNIALKKQELTAFGLFDLLKCKDLLTAEHSLNVACMTKILVRDFMRAEMGYNKAFIAGLLHDIGKVILPDYVFEDHVITTDEEMNVIKQHPVYTKLILENKGFDPDIIKAAYLHHERVDGSGYPSGLKAYDITPAARVLGIVDSFSAIIEDRPYREGQSLKRAVEILLDEKELFDVDVLSCFIKNINKVVHAASLEMIFYKHQLLKKVD